MGETHKLSDQDSSFASAVDTKSKRGSRKLTSCQIRPSGLRQHTAPRTSGGVICMRETHMLWDLVIGLASAVGTQSKRGSHLHGRDSLAVGLGHRARVSTRHPEQAEKPSAWEKLTRCRIRPSGPRQHTVPRASGGAICMGETHTLSDQAIGHASVLGTKSKRGSHLHGRNSPAVGLGHRAHVSTRHPEQAGEPSAWEKLTSCRIMP